MYTSKHAIVTFFISIPLFFVYRWWVLLIFASAILIDFDHYMTYVIKFKNLNIRKAYWYFRNISKYKDNKKILLLFHTWEFLAALLIVGFFYQIIWYIFLGFFIHILEDLYDYYTENKVYRRRLSLFFDI